METSVQSLVRGGVKRGAMLSFETLDGASLLHV